MAEAPKGTLTIQGCEKDAKGNPKSMEFENKATGCIATVKEQGPLAGLVLHNHLNKHETITVEINVPKIAVTLDGTKASCEIEPTHLLEGTYTTGNTIVTGETDPGGVMKNVWYE